MPRGGFCVCTVCVTKEPPRGVWWKDYRTIFKHRLNDLNAPRKEECGPMDEVDDDEEQLPQDESEGEEDAEEYPSSESEGEGESRHEFFSSAPLFPPGSKPPEVLTNTVIELGVPSATRTAT